MIDIDKWHEIYLTFTRHKLRTVLTAFGVFWGIFMLVALLGAGKGLQNGVNRMFDRHENVVYVWPGRTSLPYAGLPPKRWIQYDEDDLKAIVNNIKDLGAIAPHNSLNSALVTRGEKNESFEIEGEYPVYLQMMPFDISSGRFINDLDIKDRRKVAVIGEGVQKILFKKKESPIDKYIEIRGVPYKIVGTFVSRRPADDAERDEESIIVPNTTLRYSMSEATRFNRFMFIPKPGVRSDVVEDAVRKLLKERHKVHPDDKAAVTGFNLQDRFEDVQGLHRGIRIFSWLVAIGTIFAGAIGVGNIMLIVVKERTREIGIRKALGAQPKDIISMIVQESVVITAVSGYFGLVVGVALLELINAALSKLGSDSKFFTNPEINFTTAFAAVCVLILAGLLASLMPAARAAKIDPIVALQEE